VKLSPPDCPHRNSEESGYCHDCNSRPFKPSDAGLPVDLTAENQRLREENAWLRMQLSVEGTPTRKTRRVIRDRPTGKCTHGAVGNCSKCSKELFA
jgi:hypothetical protein